ncbi:VWA domain-containing protein [Pseudidiomarina sediminum]|uniref:VWA domain-containing protein n=1 Tax=Pseudidiomarina sediminum TaxID=431675 RepID=UPI001C95058C|nr:VWA domain-containing protein [Pseudidiomarina sediminum]MBY6063480.1 VWA domain-containing protein [Pseudidiomarina sediminum]
MTFEAMLVAFHFLRPWWLLGLIVPVVLLLLLWRNKRRRTGWQQVVAPHLADLMLAQQRQGHRNGVFWLAPLVLSLLVLALAGPAWEKKPQPVYQLQAGQVVVLDMSRSMLATDLAPNRLTQMRYKAMELTDTRLDGETGLIAYAGDAFVISPLTADASNLGNLIRALHPDLMPSQGSYPLAALELADQLLREAGYVQGDIYWFTDGIDSSDQRDLTNFVRNHPHRLAVMAVGTEDGAPIQLANGKLMRERNGDVVIPKVQLAQLETLANLSNGRFTQLRQDQSDLETLSSMPPLSRDSSDSNSQQQGDAWFDMGPWLLAFAALLLLPFMRRGALQGVLLVCLSGSLLGHSPSALAQTTDTATDEGLAWHQQLWQTPYQQADQALQQQRYDRAAEIAEDAWQRGTANYKRGNYEQALMDFSQLDSAEGYYNQGNSLMNLNRFDEAANVYAEALKRNPELTQAKNNLDIAEALAEQQRQQQQQNQQQGESAGDGQGQDDQQPSSSGQEGSSESSNSNAPGDAEPEQQAPESNTEGQRKPEQQRDAESQQAKDGDAESDEKAQHQLGANGDPISDEQRQQMEQWLNRIDDNPAPLLEAKMRQEARRRAHERPPQGVTKQW